MRDADIYRLEPCPICAPFWVATRTYTARCLNGQSGEQVRVTKQYKSTISLEHANTEALRLAKAEAESQIVCTWDVTACVTTGLADPRTVCAEYKSAISLEDAQEKALRAAWAAKDALV